MSALLRVLAWFTVIAGAICAVIYYAYADLWVVPTDDPRFLVSIEPMLRGGDLVLVERHGVPSLGNLVRCVDPDEPRRWVVGRIVAAAGTDLHLKGQSFNVPGSREHSDSSCETRHLTNPATGDDVELRCRNEEFAGGDYQMLSREDVPAQDSTVRVPPGKSFLLSDDRYLHLDSQDFGSVPETSCHHIVFRLWGAEGFTDGSHRFNLLW